MVMRWRETGQKPSQITWRTRWLYLSDRKLLRFKNSLKKCSKLLRSTIVLIKKLNSQICPNVTMWQNLKNNKQNKWRDRLLLCNRRKFAVTFIQAIFVSKKAAITQESKTTSDLFTLIALGARTFQRQTPLI